MLAQLFCLRKFSMMPTLQKFAVAAIFLHTTALSYACELTILEAPDFPVIEYDVFTFSQALASTEVMLRNDSEEVCDIQLKLEDDAADPPPFSFPGANLEVIATIPELLDAAQQPPVDGVYSATIEGNEVRTFTLNFFTDQHRVVPADDYNVNVHLMISDQFGANPIADFDGQLRLLSFPRAQINIAGSTATFGNDSFSDLLLFEDPTIGDSKRVFIQMRSNTLVSLSLSSQNGSLMQHVDLDDSSIEYTVDLDGQEIDLRSDVEISGYPATDLDGQSYPLAITISEFNRAFAGDYRDVINVTVTPQ